MRPLLLAVLPALLASCGPSAPERGAADPPVNPPVVVGSDTLEAEGVQAYLESALGFTSRGGRVFCSYTVLGQAGDRVFLQTLCEELVPAADSLEASSGRGGPVALVLDTLARPPRIAEHRAPRDGGLYGQDVRELFPERVRRRTSAGPGEHGRQVEALQGANRARAGRGPPGPLPRTYPAPRHPL